MPLYNIFIPCVDRKIVIEASDGLLKAQVIIHFHPLNFTG
jgi:hypothetical protein